MSTSKYFASTIYEYRLLLEDKHPSLEKNNHYTTISLPTKFNDIYPELLIFLHTGILEIPDIDAYHQSNNLMDLMNDSEIEPEKYKILRKIKQLVRALAYFKMIHYTSNVIYKLLNILNKYQVIDLRDFGFNSVYDLKMYVQKYEMSKLKEVIQSIKVKGNGLCEMKKSRFNFGTEGRRNLNVKISIDDVWSSLKCGVNS